MRRPVSLDGRIWKKEINWFIGIYLFYLFVYWSGVAPKKDKGGGRGLVGREVGWGRKIFRWVQHHFSRGNLALIPTFREKLKIIGQPCGEKITFLTIKDR